MTKQEILELYGQSVYQIRLGVAMHLFLSKNIDEALADADQFVEQLQSEELKDLKARFK